MKRLLIGAIAIATLGVQAELKDKVYRFMPLQKDLTVLSAKGAPTNEAKYSRKSTALTPDFKEAAVDAPRFWNGGLLIEHGGKTLERGAVNHLPADGKIFSVAGKKVAGVYNQEGLEFSGTWELNPVKHQPMLSGSYTFSFYAKGSGTLSVTPILKVGGKDKALPEQKFALTGNWNRYFVKLDAGARNKPAQMAETIRAKFQGQNVVISAPMLEGPSVYPNIHAPTTYVAPGKFREADKLSLSVMTPELGNAGAVAFNCTPQVICGWFDLFATDGSWRPQIALSYNIYHKHAYRYQVIYHGKTYNSRNIAFEAGKTYHYVLNWDKDKFALWVDGVKVMEHKVASKPLTKKDIWIGSRSIQASANGAFKNFAIFNQALTDAEIQKLAKNPDLSAKLR